MPDLVLEPTSTAQWHALVSEAEAACHCRLDETLESYLVFLLMRFTGRPEFAGSVLALEFLRGVHARGSVRHSRLRDVGDQCLLFSGLFPHHARRRLVRIGYFVALGRAAYHEIATSATHAVASTYSRLTDDFVSLMNVLQTMRALDGTRALDALEAVELWLDTGSRQALATLRGLTDAIPADGRMPREH